LAYNPFIICSKPTRFLKPRRFKYQYFTIIPEFNLLIMRLLWKIA